MYWLDSFIFEEKLRLFFTKKFLSFIVVFAQHGRDVKSFWLVFSHGKSIITQKIDSRVESCIKSLANNKKN